MFVMPLWPSELPRNTGDVGLNAVTGRHQLHILFNRFYPLYSKYFLRHLVEMGEVATISQRLYQLQHKKEKK